MIPLIILGLLFILFLPALIVGTINLLDSHWRKNERELWDQLCLYPDEIYQYRKINGVWVKK